MTKDLRLGRDLFSVGLDEPALLIVGRAVEGLLGEVARVRKIRIKLGNNKFLPLGKATFHDLIETLGRLRWRIEGNTYPLLSQEAKLLYDYLRSMRNSWAHPSLRSRMNVGTARDVAAVAATAITNLWAEARSSDARLVSRTVERT